MSCFLLLLCIIQNNFILSAIVCQYFLFIDLHSLPSGLVITPITLHSACSCYPSPCSQLSPVLCSTLYLLEQALLVGEGELATLQGILS